MWIKVDRIVLKAEKLTDILGYPFLGKMGMAYSGVFYYKEKPPPGRKVYLSLGRYKLTLGYWRATKYIQIPRFRQAPFFSMIQGFPISRYISYKSNVQGTKRLLLVLTHCQNFSMQD
jgi:hypothetical protein